MKECFMPRNFQKKSLARIDQANAIIDEYMPKGYVLSLRQLYYQAVARNFIENSQKSYDNFGELINNAKLAGLIDWAAIEDRRRNLLGPSHWDGPAEAIEAIADQYARDKWEGQKYRPELFIEKEALLGIVERVALANDLQFMACCGYNSGSEMYNAAQRARERRKRGQETIIVYAGDHDPSGLDMSENDMPTRFETFLRKYDQPPIKVLRIALNLDQVEQYNPPPNFAKETDARYPAYRKKYGDQCWEVDALNPDTLIALYQADIDDLKDDDLYAEMEAREDDERKLLSAASDRWGDVARFLGEGRAIV